MYVQNNSSSCSCLTGVCLKLCKWLGRGVTTSPPEKLPVQQVQKSASQALKIEKEEKREKEAKEAKIDCEDKEAKEAKEHQSYSLDRHQEPFDVILIKQAWSRLEFLTPIDVRLSHLTLGDLDIPASKIQLEDCPTVFVASTAPHLSFLPSLFWKALIHHKFSVVVDLTMPHEIYNDDDDDAPMAYYPVSEHSKTISFNRVEVTQKTFHIAEDIGICELCYELRVSEVSIKEEFTRLHYKNWQDGTAISVEHLDKIVTLLESRKEKGFWVHCRSGFGRTGTVITAYFLKHYIQRGEITAENYCESLIQLILKLRGVRGPKFIWAEVQFTLLYLYGMHLLSIASKK